MLCAAAAAAIDVQPWIKAAAEINISEMQHPWPEVEFSNNYLQSMNASCRLGYSDPRKHEPYVDASGVTHEHISEHSNPSFQCWLAREDWYTMALTCDIQGDVSVDWGGEIPKRMFHGTEWGSAKRIVWDSQAFVTGPGTRRVRNKSWTGMWCVEDFANAASRAQPDRYLVAGDYSRYSCPVVLEVMCVWLRRVPNSSMCNVPGLPGNLVEGVQIRAIHFNIKWIRNYMFLETFEARRRLKCDPFHVRRCHCRLCGTVCFPESPDFWSWEKSGNANYYCRGHKSQYGAGQLFLH